MCEHKREKRKKRTTANQFFIREEVWPRENQVFRDETTLAKRKKQKSDAKIPLQSLGSG